MSINGVAHNLVLSVLSEVGLDLKKHFKSSKHFVSWMSICPNKKISGGKILSSKTVKNKNKLALAFRQAANSIGNQKNTALSQFFKRLAYKKGRKVAITATARKLATIIYHMIVRQEQYNPKGIKEYQEKLRLNKIKNIRRNISKMNISVEELGLLTSIN